MINFLFLIFLSNAHAADEMKAGSILKEDSYVFTIKEAETLKEKIEELEKKEKILEQYIELDSLKTKQSDLLKISIDLKDQQIVLYKDIITEKDNQIEIIKKQKNKDFLNGAVIFTAGILFTGLSVYAADQLDDSIEN